MVVKIYVGARVSSLGSYGLQNRVPRVQILLPLPKTPMAEVENTNWQVLLVCILSG